MEVALRRQWGEVDSPLRRQIVPLPDWALAILFTVQNLMMLLLLMTLFGMVQQEKILLK